VPVGLAVGSELLNTRPRRPGELVGVAEYVLSVGRLNVRKNLAFTFEAALASGVLSSSRPLVVVGEPDGVQLELSSRAREAVGQGVIRFMGHLPEAELVWLYKKARLFVFLSLDEGFGLPPLEAFSFGCPVLASDIPAFRETLGESAMLVDPHDVDAAAGALRRLLCGDAPAPSAAALPTWEYCVRRLRDAVLWPVAGAPAVRRTARGRKGAELS
jgi:glycosyltransferase involved in cell wall biosynthesis